MDDVAIVQA